MSWVLVWIALGLGAGVTIFLLGRRLWRQTKALTRELGTASDRLAELTDRLADLDAARDRIGSPSDSVGSSGLHRRP
jgi:uncharacterized protein HemX